MFRITKIFDFNLFVLGYFLENLNFKKGMQKGQSIAESLFLRKADVNMFSSVWNMDNALCYVQAKSALRGGWYPTASYIA